MKNNDKMAALLRNMKPILHEGKYVFCTTEYIDNSILPNIVMIFKEKEAYTMILSKAVADTMMLHYEFEAAWITLNVYSQLDDVGLTAAFSKVLSDAHISCNVIAAYHHDHIFVPFADAKKAMDVLQSYQ